MKGAKVAKYIKSIQCPVMRALVNDDPVKLRRVRVRRGWVYCVIDRVVKAP